MSVGYRPGVHLDAQLVDDAHDVDLDLGEDVIHAVDGALVALRQVEVIGDLLPESQQGALELRGRVTVVVMVKIVHAGGGRCGRRARRSGHVVSSKITFRRCGGGGSVGTDCYPLRRHEYDGSIGHQADVVAG